jgi:DNA primase
VLCEGIETGLSVAQACHDLPVWCGLGASNLCHVGLPADVKELIIAADGDRVGEDAARAAADKFLRKGLIVKIARPEPGQDFNDYLR